MPELECCIQCGQKSEPVVFSIPDGGLLCKKCYQNTANNDIASGSNSYGGGSQNNYSQGGSNTSQNNTNSGTSN